MSDDLEYKKKLAAAIKRLESMKRTECFDPIDLDSRPTESQQAILDDLEVINYRYALGGNQSGKTQLGARETAWIFQDNHPTWKRPKYWGDEPTQILILGRTTKQLEEVIWRKLERLLEPGSYKVTRTGNTIQKITHKTSGNTILFLSHHSDREAREKVQAFVAHYAWLDEMPGSYELIEEIHRRVQKHKGYFLATFTPKSVNEKIRKLVDGSDGIYSKKYKLKMFDNPSYDDESKKMVLASLTSASDSYRQTILEGDWAKGSEMVYEFNTDLMVENPEGYSRSWRHVESVDPATESKMGSTLWAECPKSQIWYCVKAEYIEGIYDPVAILAAAQELTRGYRIVRRICDPANTWYLHTAATAGVKPTYMTPWSKNNRKDDLIKGLQSALSSGKIRIAPWCEDLISEFSRCRWSETTEKSKIINSSSFHLLDTAQYFTDLIPKPEVDLGSGSWQDDLYMKNEKRKKMEDKSRGTPGKSRGGRITVRRKKWKVS